MTPDRLRPIAFVLLSSTFIQLGTAIAITAFVAVGPATAVWVRGLVGTGVLLAWVRPNLLQLTAAQWRLVIPYGLALGGMILAFYLALADTPLGIASAIVMLGPLGVSAVAYRSRLDLAAVAVAGAGAILLSLADGVGGRVSTSGILLSLASAGAFAAYIITGKRVSRAMDGLGALCAALLVSVIAQAPFALVSLKPGIADPVVLGTLGLAGVLASVIPFTLELSAMRSLSAATFGLLLSFEPAIGALMGLLIRGQQLVPEQLLGIALVVVASVASFGPRGWTRRLGSRNRALMAIPSVAALARVPLFSGLSTQDLGTIASVAVDRDLSTGTELTHQGDPGDEFFVITDGQVKVLVDDREIRRLGPGDHLGEIALMRGGTRTATAVAASPTSLYVLPRSAFESMLRRHPRIEDKVLSSVTERMRYR